MIAGFLLAIIIFFLRASNKQLLGKEKL